jgi:hypothetical protein
MRARNKRKVITRNDFSVVPTMLSARQRAGKHIPTEENVRNSRTYIARKRPLNNNRITSITMQRTVKMAKEKELFSI